MYYTVLLICLVVDTFELDDHLTPAVVALVFECVDGKCIVQFVRHYEHRLDCKVLRLNALALAVEKVVTRTRFLVFFRLRLLLLQVIFPDFLELAQVGLHRVLVQRLKVWVPGDAEVVILVCEAFNLDLPARILGRAPFFFTLLKSLQIVGEEYVLSRLQLFEDPFLLLFDKIRTCFDQCDVDISQGVAKLGDCPQHVGHHEA